MKEYKSFLVDNECNIYNKHSRRKLTPYLNADGYMHVCGRIGKGKKVRNRVHVVLANTMIDNPNNHKYINHIDGNKTNNNLDNLEWCSNSHNVKHCWDNGLRIHKNHTKVGVYIGSSLIGNYNSIRELSEDLGLNRHTVARVLKNEIKNNFKYSFVYM